MLSDQVLASYTINSVLQLVTPILVSNNITSMTTEVDAVSLKLPTFWTSTPITWFAQAEAQFIVRNITNDDTKYYYVVAALDSSTANRAKSLLVAPPTNNKYDAIKKFLTSAYELSNYERATALYSLAGLSDSKPSELMDTMLGLWVIISHASFSIIPFCNSFQHMCVHS